jgi:hypothetical protein
MCYTPLMSQVRKARMSEASIDDIPPWLVWSMTVLPLIYLLSTGPVLKLRQAGRISPSVVLTIYAPLDHLTQICPPLDHVLKWYVRDIWNA